MHKNKHSRSTVYAVQLSPSLFVLVVHSSLSMFAHENEHNSLFVSVVQSSVSMFAHENEHNSLFT